MRGFHRVMVSTLDSKGGDNYILFVPASIYFLENTSISGNLLGGTQWLDKEVKEETLDLYSLSLNFNIV